MGLLHFTFELSPETCRSLAEPYPTRKRAMIHAANDDSNIAVIGSADGAVGAARDIGEVPAVELINTVAVHLLSASAVKLGLGSGPEAAEETDLDEARKLITALAGLVTAAAPAIGSVHAAPLRDGLRSVQLAFREASAIPDAPGAGPGEAFTGPVN